MSEIGLRSRNWAIPARKDWLLMLASLKSFFKVSERSFQGYLSLEDLYRSILTALGSGTTIGVVILVLQEVLTNTSTVFPNPTVASMATVILTMILELLRRQSQGNLPAPVVNPTPAPAPSPAPAPASLSAGESVTSLD
jgi:hypothetical protein